VRLGLCAQATPVQPVPLQPLPSVRTHAASTEPAVAAAALSAFATAAVAAAALSAGATDPVAPVTVTVTRALAAAHLATAAALVPLAHPRRFARLHVRRLVSGAVRARALRPLHVQGLRLLWRFDLTLAAAQST
jgi:hypothetical protein